MALCWNCAFCSADSTRRTDANSNIVRIRPTSSVIKADTDTEKCTRRKNLYMGPFSEFTNVRP
ncbi:MAG TPA: hypothetical protein DEQ40_11745 [Oxalobacteraceae bacterium]|nr:hypothetical protein [Oxalobacteraceae bacterium]